MNFDVKKNRKQSRNSGRCVNQLVYNFGKIIFFLKKLKSKISFLVIVTVRMIQLLGLNRVFAHNAHYRTPKVGN